MIERGEYDSDLPLGGVATPRGSPKMESSERQSGESGRACLFVLAILACYYTV